MAAFNVPLCRVDVYASCVLSSTFEIIWKMARDFGNAPWWSQAGSGHFKVVNTGGSSGTEVGTQRMFRIGSSRLFEELTALDDIEHIVRWMVVSHPKTVSPFDRASFLNYNSSLQFKPVTLSDQTFAEWTAHFYTEAHYAESMQKTLEGWFYAGFQGLQATAQLSQPQFVHGGEKQTVNKPALINPRHSVPIIPPPSDQLAFHGPGANGIGHVGNGTMTSLSGNEQARLSHPSDESRMNHMTDPRMTSHQAWQQAQAAFGNPSQGNRRRGSSTSSTQASPAFDNSRMQHKLQANGRHITSVSSVPVSTGGSNRPRLNPVASASGAPDCLNIDPHNGLLDVPNHPSSPRYAQRRMDPILESQQFNTADSVQAQQSLSVLQDVGPRESLNSRRSSHNTHHSDIVSEGKSDSLGSEAPSHGGSSSLHSGSRHTPWNSGKGLAREDLILRTMRHSFQHDPSGSDMVVDKLSAFGISRRQSLPRQECSHGHLSPDFARMKEVAYVATQQDADLLQGVADSFRKQHQQSCRSSLEEEVARLQERHNQLHKNTGNKLYSSPFSASPFEAQPSNPFAAAQTPFSS